MQGPVKSFGFANYRFGLCFHSWVMLLKGEGGGGGVVYKET